VLRHTSRDNWRDDPNRRAGPSTKVTYRRCPPSREYASFVICPFQRALNNVKDNDVLASTICGFSTLVQLRINSDGASDAVFAGWLCRYQPKRHCLRFSADNQECRPECHSVIVLWIHRESAVFHFRYGRRRFTVQQPRASQLSRPSAGLVTFAGARPDEMERTGQMRSYWERLPSAWLWLRQSG